MIEDNSNVILLGIVVLILALAILASVGLLFRLLNSYFGRRCNCCGDCCGRGVAAAERRRGPVQLLRDARREQRRQHLLEVLQRLATMGEPLSARGGAARADIDGVISSSINPNRVAVFSPHQQAHANRRSPAHEELRRLAFLLAAADRNWNDRQGMREIFQQLHSIGLDLAAEEPTDEQQHYRYRLSSKERRNILESILEFRPFGAEDNGGTGEEVGGDLENSSGNGNAVQGKDCAICLDDFAEGDPINVPSGCPHIFHKDCLLSWLEFHDMCPICRRTMVTEDEWRDGCDNLLRSQAKGASEPDLEAGEG